MKSKTKMELQSINDIQAMERGKTDNQSEKSAGSSADGCVTPQKPPLLLFWQLIPFLRRIFLYFAIIALYKEEIIQIPLVLKAILTCAPLMTLTVFIFRQFNSIRKLYRNSYALFVFTSLLLSMTGAMIVAFHHDIEILFLIGKSLHLVSLILYTCAFGFFPFASRLFVRSIIAGGLGYYYLFLGAVDVSENFDLISKVGTAVYMATFFTMQWRAWARIGYQDLKQGRWYKFAGALGASLIVIAESITIIDRFLKPSDAGYFLLGANYSIEAFFFIGNLGVALSVLDQPNEAESQKQTELTKKIEPLRRSCLCMDDSSTNFKNSFIGLSDWIFS